MNTGVKHHSDQETTVKPTLFQWIWLLFFRHKKKEVDEMSEDEMKHKIANIKFKELDINKLKGSIMYEISFLGRMISGEFNNITSFSTKRDKRLFEEFNKLNSKEREEKYASLKEKLESPIL